VATWYEFLHALYQEVLYERVTAGYCHRPAPECEVAELRAVMNLSRLWQQQGKKNEARQMLAEIYGWFTEGFDTADLQEAKALLEELREATSLN